MTDERFSIYLTPEPGHPLAIWGAEWLGWDIERGQPAPERSFPGFSDEWRRTLVAEPRPYGFHATLKAPFRLRPGADAAELVTAVRGVAARHGPFVLALRPVVMSGFVCLRPTNDTDVSALARDCVTSLDNLRAALTETEIARRRPKQLSERQNSLLALWGYPYVLEEYRPHFTLTGKMSADRGQALENLEKNLGDIDFGEVSLGSIAVCRQSSAGASFVVHARVPLIGGV